MALNMIPYDPFGDLMLADPLRAMDELLRETQRCPWRDLARRAPAIRVDVHETDQDYSVKAEIPGAKKEDIKVDVQGNQVTIGAEIKREVDQGGDGALLRSERYYGQVSRTFVLPAEIDEAKAEAHYADGVLQLTLPKKTGNGGRKLPIQ